PAGHPRPGRQARPGTEQGVAARLAPEPQGRPGRGDLPGEAGRARRGLPGGEPGGSVPGGTEALTSASREGRDDLPREPVGGEAPDGRRPAPAGRVGAGGGRPPDGRVPMTPTDPGGRDAFSIRPRRG